MDETIIQQLCERLKCFTLDIEKLHQAKMSLNSLQSRKTFNALLGLGQQFNAEQLELLSFHRSDPDLSHQWDEGEEEDCGMFYDLPEDKWHGYFEGFEILTEPAGVNMNENMKCIELTKKACEEELQHYLRTGIRAFMIDLFTGMQKENQTLIVHLRESEIKVSEEFGFPVVSTIFARLSSRYQYTGDLQTDEDWIELIKGKRIFLTTDRKYSTKCSTKYIYVNARFLLADVKQYDFILIGCEIQLLVLGNYVDFLHCCVARGGRLKSRLPVRFPARCKSHRISYEELEDMTFAKETGINVIVSDITGTIKYLNNLQKIMGLLDCEKLKLFARVIVNKIQGCEGEMNWVVEKYDGFLVEVAPPAENEDVPAMMHLCPDGECFLKLAYESKKPIIFDPTPIAMQQLRIEPEHYFYTFYYPDKYLVRCNQSKSAFYFTFLQNAIFETIPPMTLAPLPYCDASHTGADALARAAVAASFELEAAAIIVCGLTVRMVQKLAHFRPKAPIIFVSHMLSAEDYVSLYHNVIMLPVTFSEVNTHEMEMFKKAIFALAYLRSRKYIKDESELIIIYSSEPGTQLPDKYITFKFNMKKFTKRLAANMFSTPTIVTSLTTLKDIN